jgi:Zn-dependent peptidase ImmA (M78 family)
MSNLLLEKKANQFREQQGLSPEEAVDLSSLLIKLEVNTLFHPLSNSFSGMALKAKEDTFIMVNTNQSVGRQHFTLAHELYHLFVQENFRFRTCQVAQFNKAADAEEFNADLFAAYFLMPQNGIIALIPDQELATKKAKVGLETIVRLEQYYKVSRRAILYRLRELAFITRTDYDTYSSGVIKSAQAYGYDASLYTKTADQRFVGNYGKKAKRLFDHDRVSEGDYAALMMDIGIDIFSEEAGTEND